jgi:beta-lactamase class A/uncharacterized membrane protein
MTIAHRDVQRLAAFSDAVFAFALTLLVVSLQVPSNYQELMQTMRGFVPFACTFAVVTWIWYEHHEFFRKYPMNDPYTVFLNGVLLFLVLFYVYPLKFMATVVFAMFGLVDAPVLSIRRQEIPRLLAVYSGGFVVLFAAFTLLYRHAWTRRGALGLSAQEASVLKTDMGHQILSMSVGLLSVVMALTLPHRWAWLAGPVYFVMGPVHYLWAARAARKNQKRGGRVAVAGVILLTTLASPSAALAQQPQPIAPRQRVQSSVERITRSVNATWGIYARCLERDEEFAIDADRQMDTMSVIKIPLMIEVFQQVKDGRLAFDTRYTVAREDVLPGTGVLRSLDPGAVISVRDLVTLMIIVSDNTATDILYRMVGGPEAVTRRMNALGLPKTVAPAPSRAWFDALRAAPSAEQFHRDAKHPFGLSTPREIGRLLEGLSRGTIIDKAASDQMLQILRGQVYRTRIPRFLTGFRIPHKTGDFLPYIGNDVGLLETPGTTIVLSVFTANHFGSGEILEEAIGRVAQEIAAYCTYR